MRRPAPVLLLLPLLLALAACDPPPPPAPPDWPAVEGWLASPDRRERAKGIQAVLLANEDAPGTLMALAEIPEDATPGLRHYTAACLLITIRGEAATARRQWIPGLRTLELLVAGLDDERDLPVGGAADWDLPVGRFCLSALESLTGEDAPPRPVNLMPSRPAVARWRKWWLENRDYLVYDPDRGIWTPDTTAKALQIRLGRP